MRVTVVGAGTMGSGIAYVFAMAGHNVTVVEQNSILLKAGLERIREYAKSGLEKGKVSQADVDSFLRHLHSDVDLGNAAKSADLTIEAVFEEIKAKTQVLSAVEKHTSEDSIIASNTSSLSINDLAAVLNHPQRFLGIHFFNPVPAMKLVEIVSGSRTSPGTLQRVVEIVKQLGKTEVIVADSPGFIVNRALMPLINEAAYLLHDEVASRDDIDKAFELGTNFPLGPLKLADFIGLDVTYSIMKSLEESLGPKFAPCPLIEAKVRAGELGRKTRKGFYTYGELRSSGNRTSPQS